MTDREQVQETSNIMGSYETHDISDFIKMLQECQAEGWKNS